MASQLHILFEHASGYALFFVKEAEDIGALLPTVERGITDYSLFASTVKLVSFSPFKSGTNALDNMNSISEGILHDDLKNFLETNVPKKKGGVLLGIEDTRLSGAITEETGIKCTASEVVCEILRGLRVHFPSMIKGLTLQAQGKAQLGLGHSYSRAKVKFNVNRADNMIIQSIALLDQLDKDINTFSMRVKEWYSYHFPELVKISSDNYMYCRLVRLMGNRKEVPEDIEEKLEEITMDSAKAQAIISASKMSMGMDVSPIDLINIESFCSRVISLTDYRKGLVEYLHKRMGSVAPNLSTLIGDVVGARLISHAGSLTSLAKYPASTVQILGAEKALFRALKSKGNTPKYGLIFHSTFIGRAGAKNKGRISRYLANKCSIASRIDCFSEYPNNVFGEKLKDQVEERLKFYETGDAPRKNVDVMKEAVLASDTLSKTQMQEEADQEVKKSAKKKKRKKSKGNVTLETEVLEISEVMETPKSDKKKKKKSKSDVTLEKENLEISEVMETPKSDKKKKKKKKVEEESEESMEVEEVVPETPKSDKKKKKSVVEEETPKKKKKRKSDVSMEVDSPKLKKKDENVADGNDSISKKKKKKKKGNDSVVEA